MDWGFNDKAIREKVNELQFRVKETILNTIVEINIFSKIQNCLV